MVFSFSKSKQCFPLVLLFRWSQIERKTNQISFSFPWLVLELWLIFCLNINMDMFNELCLSLFIFLTKHWHSKLLRSFYFLQNLKKMILIWKWSKTNLNWWWFNADSWYTGMYLTVVSISKLTVFQKKKIGY